MPQKGEWFQVERLLHAAYPHEDTFVRRREWTWSAEVVAPGQSGPPYATLVVAEAASLGALRQALEAHES